MSSLEALAEHLCGASAPVSSSTASNTIPLCGRHAMLCYYWPDCVLERVNKGRRPRHVEECRDLRKHVEVSAKVSRKWMLTRVFSMSSFCCCCLHNVRPCYIFFRTRCVCKNDNAPANEPTAPLCRGGKSVCRSLPASHLCNL